MKQLFCINMQTHIFGDCYDFERPFRGTEKLEADLFYRLRL
jgi:hypothetical protein